MNWRKPTIYGLLHLSGSQIPAALTEMKRWEYLSQSDLQARQDDKLKKLLLHAHTQVPYYQRILEEYGVVEQGQVHLEKFTQLPLLTKDIIRQEGDNLYARDYQQRGFYKNTSGGSTGAPVEFIQDKQYDAWNTATKLYFNQILGKDEGDPEIKFWGSDRDILAGSLTLKDRMINWLYHREFFNSYRLGQEDLQRLVALNNRFKPTAYWSYMESALELARYLKEHPQDFVPPRFVISTIGPLTEETKNEIETHMKCRVYNQYGSREVGVIACQCKEQKGLHCFPWRNRTEIVNQDDQPMARGEGRVVITPLDNYSMPLIRYEIGDVAVAGGHQCACGRQTFQLESVMGRTLGYFKKPDGSLAHSHFLVQVLLFRDWIKRFQIIQDAMDHLLIRIERASTQPADHQELQEIVAKSQVLMGDSCVVDFDFVDEIERSASGKFVYTICRI